MSSPNMNISHILGCYIIFLQKFHIKFHDFSDCRNRVELTEGFWTLMLIVFHFFVLFIPNSVLCNRAYVPDVHLWMSVFTHLQKQKNSISKEFYSHIFILHSISIKLECFLFCLYSLFSYFNPSAWLMSLGMHSEKHDFYYFIKMEFVCKWTLPLCIETCWVTHASMWIRECTVCMCVHHSWLTPDDKVGGGRHIVNRCLCGAGVAAGVPRLCILNQQLTIWAPILDKTTQDKTLH